MQETWVGGSQSEAALKQNKTNKQKHPILKVTRTTTTTKK
jgi:hypothetical protein